MPIWASPSTQVPRCKNGRAKSDTIYENMLAPDVIQIDYNTLPQILMQMMHCLQ